MSAVHKGRIILALNLLALCCLLVRKHRDLSDFDLTKAPGVGNVELATEVSFDVSKIKPAETLSQEEFTEKMTEENKNIPFDLLSQTPGVGVKIDNANCSVVPPCWLNLRSVNGDYQTFRHWENETFYLYSAHLDARPAVPVVRVIGTISNFLGNSFDPMLGGSVRCLLFSIDPTDGSTRVIMAKLEQPEYYKRQTSKKAGEAWPYTTFEFQCSVPADILDSLTYVSVTNQKRLCEQPTNALDVRKKTRLGNEKKTLGVCVKEMFFLNFDISLRLIEWFELLKLQKFDKVFVYVQTVHPNISRVLSHYESTGFVETTRMRLAGELPSDDYQTNAYRKIIVAKADEKWSHRNAAFQYMSRRDCIFRNLHNFKYLTNIDTDDIFVPANKSTGIPDILESLERDNTNPDVPVDQFKFDRLYYPPVAKESDTIHVLGHGTVNYSESLYMTFNRFSRGLAHNHKMIFNTETVGRTDPHSVLTNVQDRPVNTIYVDVAVARSNHYRVGIEDVFEVQQPLVNEPTVPNYKELPQNVIETMKLIYGS